jgi:hypothetical protein
MSIYVFLGPTVSREDALAELPAHYLPPAEMGDIFVVAEQQPEAVLLIDGLFDCTPSVWHKEILFALSRGIPVYGSSSMGALRAAELAPFGMVGVGRIFEWFAQGTLTDDDEVAVVHGSSESGYAPISEAMVNIRDALALAEERGLVSPADRSSLTDVAKGLFYAERLWPTILARGKQAGVPEETLGALRGFLEKERPNLKRSDALQLLRHVRSLGLSGLPRPEVTFDLEWTTFWATMITKEAGARRRALFGGSMERGAPGPDRA